MKNMVILIDTNVLLNYLTNRDDPYLEQSIEIVRMCATGKCIGYIAFHTLSILWYVLRRWDDEERRQSLKAICDIFYVAAASQDAIREAIENDRFTDFEDCLQDKCAREVRANYIITCNLSDYKAAEVPSVTPKQFLMLIENQRK